MAGKRWYNDGCAVSHALDLIGDRWALPVVRELLLGPKRFTDLRSGLPGASPDMLSQRLRELRQAGVVRQHRLPPPAAAWVYELTEWGAELAPVVTQLGRWGGRSPLLRHDIHSSVDSLMLSLRATFDPEAAAGAAMAVALRLGDDRFRVRIAGGAIRVERGDIDRPDVVLDTDSHTLDDLLYGGMDLESAVHAGTVRVTGTHAVAQRFLDLFPLPDQVPAVSERD
ncbi:transcriptional regulator [Nocardia abscessus]|uniref:winged helix-turn-helix transcriptional regulator n=1 Tax=Nocardia abscessus TaxID=120957 RepID=UPI0018952C68|nr:winged helix-turn-helix transcriptional regulator [Nocardia abscessus]MBF6341483.1 transcriptional regulator [Nocardia abscessus]